MPASWRRCKRLRVLAMCVGEVASVRPSHRRLDARGTLSLANADSLLTAIKYKTARAILYREDRYLLAVHSSFWAAQERRWGLPGGRIEWRETPQDAVARELREELYVHLNEFTEVGDFHYKRALHKVFAAELDREIQDYDESELLDLRWFSGDAIVELAANNQLHAGYELQAIQLLQTLIGR